MRERTLLNVSRIHQVSHTFWKVSEHIYCENEQKSIDFPSVGDACVCLCIPSCGEGDTRNALNTTDGLLLNHVMLPDTTHFPGCLECSPGFDEANAILHLICCWSSSLALLFSRKIICFVQNSLKG